MQTSEEEHSRRGNSQGKAVGQEHPGGASEDLKGASVAALDGINRK